MNELKPCPFCDGKASILVKDWDNRADEYKIVCSLCGVMQDTYTFEKGKAIAAWNRRVGEE